MRPLRPSSLSPLCYRITLARLSHRPSPHEICRRPRHLHCSAPSRLQADASSASASSAHSSALTVQPASTHRPPYSPALAQLGRVLEQCLADPTATAFELRAGLQRARLHWQEACLEDFDRQLRCYAPTIVERRQEAERTRRDEDERRQWPTLGFTEANRAELQGKVAALHREHAGAALQIQAVQDKAREERLALPSSGRAEPQLQLPDMPSIEKSM